MIAWLKKYFVPHESNGYRPHILHKKTTEGILIGLFLVELVVFILPTLSIKNLDLKGSILTGAVLPAVLDNLTNQKRQVFSLSELKESALLDKAAQMKAEDMASKGYFAHTSPEGKEPWYWFDQVGYKYNYAGENLAVNFNDSKDVSEAWMNSPTHRANLLKPVYREVGTGIATGIYKGQPAVFVAQLYGTPKPTPITQDEPAPILENDRTEPLISANQKTEAENVLGASIENTEKAKPSAAEKMVASPRHTTNVIFLTIFSIMFISLILKLSFGPNRGHDDLIINGLLIIVVIFGLYLINEHISTKNAQISVQPGTLSLGIIDTKTKIG
jgi:hypothetical protein